MGSIETPLASTGTDYYCVATRLPPFLISSPRSDVDLLTSHSRSVHVELPHIHDLAEHTLLCRFARFVSDVVLSDNVSFFAQAPQLGAAVMGGVVGAKSSSSSGIELALLPWTATAEESDFEIRIRRSSSNGAEPGWVQKRPFILIVETTMTEKFMITLSLRTDYGGIQALQSLLDLSIAYLSSDPSEQITTLRHNLQPSRINFAPFVSDAPQVYHQSSSTNAKPRLLHSAFEENAAKHPDSVAIDYLYRNADNGKGNGNGNGNGNGRRDLTYGELNGLAEKLANHLGHLLDALKSKWTPARNDQYGFPLFIPPSPELFLAMISVLKCGHAFSSLPADAPADRLRIVVEDLGSPVVLGVGDVPWYGLEGLEDILWIDVTSPEKWTANRLLGSDVCLLEQPSSRRVSKEEDLCYLFYTSGSTGKPKGVLGTHRAGAACVDTTISGPLSHLPRGPRVRWLNLSAPSFDPMIIDTFVSLSLGGVLCAVERDLLLTDLEASARELRVTASYAVASLALLMRPEKVPELRTLIVGGEAVNSRVVEKFAPTSLEDGDADRHLVNAYGPTETTIFCTVEMCTKSTRSSVIGGALASAFFFLVDADLMDNTGELREIPLGLVGELVVGGPQVAAGYLNRPDATKHAFLCADAFPTLGLPTGTMLYRTGDKARYVWNNKGEMSVDFIGRISTDQVKLNGRRVELTEIENVLSSADGVASVAVVAMKNHQGQKTELIAFITLWSNGMTNGDVEQDCRKKAAAILPDWMCPTRYIAIEKLPYTSSGKVDRKNLAQLVAGPQKAIAQKEKSNGTKANGTNGVQKPVSAPASLKEPEEIVRYAMVEALGDHAASADLSTSPLSIGLDSLRAMLLLQSFRDSGVHKIALHDVIACPTISTLVQLVQESITGGHSDNNKQETNGHGNEKTRAANGTLSDAEIEGIAANDEEALYMLSVPDKLRHFAYHCRKPCEQALRLAPDDIAQVLPTTSDQTRLLYSTTKPEKIDGVVGRVHFEHFVYNVPLDALDPTRLRKAVEAVVSQHDCFRTVYCEVQHPLSPFALCVLQTTASRAKTPIVEITCPYDGDWRNLDDRQEEERASLWQHTQNAAQRSAEAMFQTDRPGIVVTWLHTPKGQGKERQVLILSLFHLVYDGVSLMHLRDEIAKEYRRAGEDDNGHETTDTSSLQLLSVSDTQNLVLQNSPDWMETMTFWMNRLAGVVPFQMGTRRLRPLDSGLRPLCRGFSETHMRSAALRSSRGLSMNGLSAGAAKMGTTSSAVIQAAWANVLAQTRTSENCVSEDGTTLHVLFGNVLHGRWNQDLWRCMAPLMTSLLVFQPIEVGKHRKKANPSNREICHRMAQYSAEAIRYIDTPCPTRDLYELGITRFDTLIMLQAHMRPPSSDSLENGLPDLPGWNVGAHLLQPYKDADSGIPLYMEIFPAYNKAGIDWDGLVTYKGTYNPKYPGYGYLDEQRVLGMMDALDEVLVDLLTKPDAEYCAL